MQPQHKEEGRWEYPPLLADMLETVLEEVETYVLRRQNTISQYIANHPILELFLEADRGLGVQV